MKYSKQQQEDCHTLYLRGMTVDEIAERTNVHSRTVYIWAQKHKWDEQLNREDGLYSIRKRIRLLLEREKKTNLELKELDRLLVHIEKIEEINARAAVKMAERESGGGSSGEGRKSRFVKSNDFRDVDSEFVIAKLKEGLFQYQLDLWDCMTERTRNILKSRQVGLTYYFAKEAFANALLTGDNQIFLSASRAQADVFREYIKAFAREWFGVELKGKDKIVLQTKHGTATLYFLSTNSSTAQSYHGHVYIDEYLWIPKFEILKKVATAMASHKKWRKTFFSTPSAQTHPGYAFWSGDEYNKRMKKASKPDVVFPERGDLRKAGIRCADGQWRKIITVFDAVKGGCNLFDIEQLKLEYSEEEFEQLFNCHFIDDTQSVFRYKQLEKCLVDPDTWKDVRQETERPYSGDVWIGYDPSRERDGACIAVVAAPTTYRGKIRVIERINMRNESWQDQAARIEMLTHKYNVVHIAIDKGGNGSGVFEMVQMFFPAVLGIHYSLKSKERLILKAQQVISEKRLEWDLNYSDIGAAFMQIRRKCTEGGDITYVATRSAETGHADAAFAVMHALTGEDFILPVQEREGSWAFSA